MKRLFFYFSLFFFVIPLFADELIIEPEAGRQPILSAIKQTKSSLSLVMYGLTDEQFIKALIALKNQGKEVNILMEPEPYKARGENFHAIQQFQYAHLNLYWPDKLFNLVHQKTLIVDNHSALIMTFNLTHSTFSRERNFALIITDPAEVHEIQQVFTADIHHQQINPSHPLLVWSPNNSRNKILTLIQQAHSHIEIYAEALTDYQIIGALAKAAREGVKIKILLSNHSLYSHNNKLAFLKKARIRLAANYHYLIHAKVMIIDDEEALLGSINFTAPSLDHNRELSVITHDTKIIKQLKQIFTHDWQEAEKTI